MDEAEEYLEHFFRHEGGYDNKAIEFVIGELDKLKEYFSKENVHEIRGMSLFIAIDSVKQKYVCKLIDLSSFKRMVFKDINNPERDQGLIKGVVTLKTVLQNILDGN